jgi:hypothetical protein
MKMQIHLIIYVPQVLTENPSQDFKYHREINVCQGLQSDTKLLPHVFAAKLPTPVKVEILEKYLKGYDSVEVKYLIMVLQFIVKNLNVIQIAKTCVQQ